MKRTLTILTTVISIVVLSSAVLAKESRYPKFGNGRIELNLVEAGEYMVSSANPYASEAGMRIIAKGGSAIDAAIAVQMVLNLVEPESSGIGGGAAVAQLTMVIGSTGGSRIINYVAKTMWA